MLLRDARAAHPDRRAPPRRRPPGPRRPRHRPSGASRGRRVVGQGRHRRRARRRAQRPLQARRRRHRRRGPQVHAQRRQARHPERDLGQRQGRRAGRERLRLPGPRQRLAEHLPAVPDADEGRHRARSRPAAPTARATSTTARTTSATTSRSRPTPSCSCTTSATRRATPSPASPEGTFADARLRVDNYGAGFIEAGARVVIAEGHPDHPATSEIRTLFTTNRTMDQVFRGSPAASGHLQGPFASQRSPGLSFEMDPDTAAPSGFYRSIVGDLGLRAGAVTGNPPSPTWMNPSHFAVPGAAEVVDAGGVGLYASHARAQDPAATATTTLPVGTRLRITREVAAAADGTRVFAVTRLGTSNHGYVRATGLAPRDSTPTVAWSLDHSGPLLSPNADGTGDALVVAARFSEPVLGDAQGQEQGRDGRPVADAHGRPVAVRVGPAGRVGQARARRRLHVVAAREGRLGQPWGRDERRLHDRRHGAGIDGGRATRPRGPPAGASRRSSCRSRPGTRSRACARSSTGSAAAPSVRTAARSPSRRTARPASTTGPSIAPASGSRGGISRSASTPSRPRSGSR